MILILISKKFKQIYDDAMFVFHLNYLITLRYDTINRIHVKLFSHTQTVEIRVSLLVLPQQLMLVP